MKRSISGIKDVDREVLLKMSDKDLLQSCSVNKYFQTEVCNDTFLMKRLSLTYPDTLKYKGRESWRQYFLKVIRSIAKMQEDYNYVYQGGDAVLQYKIFEDSKVSPVEDKYYRSKKREKPVLLPNNLLINSTRYGVKNLVEEALKRGAIEIYLALYEASSNGYIEIVKYLVEGGANSFPRMQKVFLVAASAGHFDIVQYFIEQGVNMHLDDEYLLRMASKYGRLDLVLFLVGSGANIHALDDNALKFASGNGHLNIVQYLVENGADIHHDKENALRTAAVNGHIAVVKYLVEHGADVHADNNYALKIAVKRGHKNLVNYILSLK